MPDQEDLNSNYASAVSFTPLICQQFEFTYPRKAELCSGQSYHKTSLCWSHVHYITSARAIRLFFLSDLVSMLYILIPNASVEEFYGNYI